MYAPILLQKRLRGSQSVIHLRNQGFLRWSRTFNDMWRPHHNKATVLQQHYGRTSNYHKKRFGAVLQPVQYLSMRLAFCFLHYTSSTMSTWRILLKIKHIDAVEHESENALRLCKMEGHAKEASHIVQPSDLSFIEEIILISLLDILLLQYNIWVRKM